MPKKMGENSKAVEARERKKAAKLAAQEKTAKEVEDKLWQDNDKFLAKKKQRKDEEEKKKAEQAKKKAEARALLEQEMASIKSGAKQSVQKASRHQIQLEVERRNKNMETAQTTNKLPSRVVKQDLMQENLNRAMSDAIIATNIDEAIVALSVREIEEDKHPEKRMKAAFKAFEAENLPRIKLENPTLRMSQWKQILTKEWNKSPQNPINQRY